MEVKGHGVEEEGVLGGKRILGGGRWRRKWEKGVEGNSLPRSLFSIQMEVVLNLTATLR